MSATADKGRRRSLRWWLLAVMAAVALLPALVVAAVGYGSLQRLAELAAEQSHRAVEREVRLRLETRVQELARADDALFRQVQDQADTLARYAAWMYENRSVLKGYFPGNTALERNEQGHLANDPASAVGVFVSNRARVDRALWDEVLVLSYVDPLLLALQQDNPHAARIWIISASGIVRIYPNPGLGHPGSPVGPDYDLTRDEPFQALAPDRNPRGRSRWTAPYWDPAGSGWLITAGVPIYVAGEFKAVAGVDMALGAIRDQVLQVSAGPGSYAFLADGEGRLVSAPAAAYSDLQLQFQTPAPGQGAAAALAASPLPGVRQLAGALRPGGTPSGLIEFAGAGGPRYLAAAPLPATGWTLALVLPEAEVTAAAAAAQAEIAATGRRMLVAWAATLALVPLLILWVSSRAAAGLIAPLRRLVEGTRRLADDLSYRLPRLPDNELGELAREFNAMGDKLEASRAAALAAARLAGEERERAVRSAELAVAEERNRLAREMHDTLAQGLAGIVLQLEAAEDSLPPDAGTAAAHLSRARELARDSLQEARRSVWNLRPRRLVEAGLRRALAALAEEATAVGLPVAAELAETGPLPGAAEEALYRVAQEALANVRRHSGARQAGLALAPAPGPGGAPGVALTIWDDGRGFDPAARPSPRPDGGFGLWAMAERARAVGGELAVESEPGQGTRVRLWLPLKGGDGDGAGDQGAGGG